MLDRIFSGDMGDASRFSVAGLIVMALGVLLALLARPIAKGVQWKLYWVMKLGGLILVMMGALLAMKVL